VVEWLRYGVPLPLVRNGIEILRGRVPGNRIKPGIQTDWWDKEVERLLRVGALALVSEKGDKWPNDLQAASPVRLVDKPGPKLFRAVINMRAVNAYLPQRHFKMESLGSILRGIGRGWWMVTWDLANGYHQVRMATDAQRLLGIRWRNRWLRFVGLPFGVSTAPWTFTKIMREVIKHWRQMGIFVWAYLDDFLLAAPTRELALQWRQQVTRDMHSLGLIREPTKGQWDPAQRVQVLGLIIDTASGSVEVPEVKMTQVVELAQHLFEVPVGQPIPVRRLASTAGKVVALSRAFAPARLLTRSFFRLFDAAHRNKWQWNEPVIMTTDVQIDAQRLLQMLPRFNGKAAWWPARTEVVFTDASTMGWGAVWRSLQVGAPWTIEERNLHINLLEIRAVWYALQAFGTQLAGRRIHLKVDNQVARAYLAAQGGRVSVLSLEAERVWLLAIQLQVDIWHASWIRSEDNPADSPSRVDWDDWSVAHTTFLAIDRLWGPHTCDRFASVNNRQLLSFNHKQMDAFTQSWLGHNNWLVPPFYLIGNALLMLAQERAMGTLILPWWPAQPWWPLLCAMAVAFVELSPEDITVGQSGFLEPDGHRMAAVRVLGNRAPPGFEV
jgi:hypothetical protein